MKILSFNLSKISAEKKENIKKRLQVNQNIDIKNITKEKLPLTNEEVLKVNFSFSVSYSEDYAKILLEGYLLVIPEKPSLNEILKSWKKKDLSAEFKIPLFNFIMSKCNIKALNLEDELFLPYHLPLPKLSPKS